MSEWPQWVLVGIAVVITTVWAVVTLVNALLGNPTDVALHALMGGSVGGLLAARTLVK